MSNRWLAIVAGTVVAVWATVVVVDVVIRGNRPDLSIGAVTLTVVGALFGVDAIRKYRKNGGPP